MYLAERALVMVVYGTLSTAWKANEMRCCGVDGATKSFELAGLKTD